MQSVKRMIVDMSSVCWTSLLAGRDEEFGRNVDFEGRPFYVNSAGFGFENALNHVTAAMEKFDITPIQMILVVEGAASKSLRCSMMESYKGGSGKKTRPEEAYVEFNKLKEMLSQAFLDVGAQVVTQDGVEADDVIAYLAQELDGEKVILSNDGDLLVLVNETTHVYKGGEVDVNPYGPFSHKYITLYKSLVGDSSDKIPGAFKFGEKAFLDLLCVFGESSFDTFVELIEKKQLAKLAEDVGELKALQKVIDHADMVYKSYACAKLYPNLVNTLRKPLVWRAGRVAPLTATTDPRLAAFAGRVRLVHKANYAAALEWMKPLVAESPFVSLDIETSTSDESDEWLVNTKKAGTDDDKLGVDVFGSVLTGLGLTFGRNNQYTLYFTVDHKETDEVKNLTVDQVLDVVKSIPSSVELETIVHNDSFELSVLKQTWAHDEEWQNNGWHGFLPHVRDTVDCASYVDENESFGLKKLSLRLMNYQQQEYKDVTTIDGVQYRMNELTAEHVLGYGADDTICTAAIYNHFRIIMEIEKTWEVFRDIEQGPAYLAADAFLQGTPFSLQRLKELEKEDDEVHAKAWATVRNFLITKGWDGTVCPVYTELTPAAIKEAVFIVTGLELKTQVRTVSKFPPLITELASEVPAGASDTVYLRLETLAQIVEKGDIENLNKVVAHYFTGEPQINFDSSKQMQNLLYHVLNLPVRIVNKLTPKERKEKTELATAVSKFNKIAQGSKNALPLTDAEKELLKVKAATDDTAVDFALAYDCPEGSEARVILEAMTTVKKVETRRKLYYKPYPNLMHWRDRKFHPSLNQNQAVTRRYSDSGPNRQQLAKKGDGVKVRETITPHDQDCVVVSIDFIGQELRLMAGQSKDPNMLACYIGDKLKDIHSITASGAMPKKWGKAEVKRLADELGMDCDGADALYELFLKLRKSDDKATAKKADDLRKDGKNVNFATQFDAQALKVSHMTIMSVEDAQAFIDAKQAMFPQVEVWKDEVRAFVMKYGFVTTLLGARRHLRHAVLSEDKWEAERAGRQGPNFKIQGSGVEMTKLAMKRLWLSDVLYRLRAQFYAPIHDELVASVHKDDAIEFIKVMHECMTQDYANLGVPVMGSISLGVTFGQQIECGDWFIEENIRNALQKCEMINQIARRLSVLPCHVAAWDQKYPIKEGGVQVGFTSPATNDAIYYKSA